MLHHFTLILADLPEMTLEASEALYEAGCDDGSPASCNGISRVDFHREAASLEEAIRSAIADVRAARFEVERVEIEPAVVA
jgi:hypothetical protein